MSTKFYPLQVKEVKPETQDTVSVSFEVPADLKGTFSYKAGQYLTLKTNLKGEEVRRSYSICTSPSSGDLRVAVKRLENGAFSTFATKELKAGDLLDVMAPLGNFTVTPDASSTKNYAFFAAGSGITPVISMISSLLETEKNSTIYLFYANRTKSDTIFRSTLDALASTNSNLKIYYFLTREDSGNELTNGRIDKTRCEKIHTQILAGVTLSGIYACGPQEMIMDIKDFFISKGIDSGKIHFELFTATAPEKTEIPAGEVIESSVTVIMDDEPYKFTLSSNGKTILQAAQDAGADVPFSCKGGVCCTCKAKVMEGSAKMDLNYALEPDEVEAGFILTCQSHPTSSKVVVSFDEY